ncbi:MarR family transcriptional regulator [Streptomyces sp. MUM 203J]|uniref:MarR family transcriptional regulator n=1 Tax=Streptomyces sp. MUM 203J TaxID=2791990 RepID=UPI001F0421B5|nr:MarR family transcriptional regulator [Streptomyces sp. MUM 203J]MCH0539803.1 MarR family transcriptional regulator [Streptomyces sp. MUM 203J]
MHASMQRAGHGVLHRALAQCRTDRATLALHVDGRPGGTFHLRRGAVVAVETPGAPGIEALLLRSGRVGADDWAGTASGMPAAELVARGVVGAAELRVLSEMALQDAVFAVVAGETGECAAVPDSGAVVPVATGEDPERLLEAASRRFAALVAMPHAVLPDRDRVTSVSHHGTAPSAAAAEDLPPHRREILFLADGRRTPRDIAFAVGRGVYHVTVEASRMLGEGMLRRVRREHEPGSSPRVWTDRVPAPRRTPAVGRSPTPYGTAPYPHVELPRRIPGASGITGGREDDGSGRASTRTLAADEPATSRKGPFRMQMRKEP